MFPFPWDFTSWCFIFSNFRKDSLYTIDYDSEGWIQLDSGHKYELFNNLNDDWEMIDVEADDNNVPPLLDFVPVPVQDQ